MDLPQIKYFFAVCQVQSFTRAALICGISQPSLSIAIRRLEEELGGPLFDRGPPVLLSPLGEAIKPHFEAIFREVDKIHRLGPGISEGAAPSEKGKRKFRSQDALKWIAERQNGKRGKPESHADHFPGLSALISGEE